MPFNHFQSILKYVFLFLLLILARAAFSQEGYLPLDETKKVLYTDMGKVDKSKSELYKMAQAWVAGTFGNYENAISSEDANSGKLIITSYVPVITTLYEYVRFDLTIACTDGKYQARLENLDGVSAIRSPAKLGQPNNDAVAAKEMSVKTETSRKKRAEIEQELHGLRADQESINSAMYKLLASLKQAMSPEAVK